MTCPCDERAWPPTLHIPAGLRDLPRQLVTFGELRAEMMARARFQQALGAWRARDRADFGVMLVEAWAYVGELLSIYDKAIADESYLRTAKLRPSLRRLVAGLGYQPRPAVAATVDVALIADGVRTVALPAGTAFRSGAFDDQPPQVFELPTAATIHPALNRWPIATPVASTLSGELLSLLVDPKTLRLGVGDLVVAVFGSQATDVFVRKVAAVDRIVDDGRRRLARVTFDRAITLATAKLVSAVRLWKPTRRCGLKGPALESGEYPPFHSRAQGSGTWYLWKADGVHAALHAGQHLIVENGGEHRVVWIHDRQVHNNVIVASAMTPAVTIDLPDSKTAKVHGTITPAIQAPFTYVFTWDDPNASYRKATSGSPTWVSGADPTAFTLHFAMAAAGTVVGPLQRTLPASAPLLAGGTRKPVGASPTTNKILLRDAEARGLAVAGAIDLDSGVISRDGGVSWTPALAAPVEGFGNVVTLIRGETVPHEVLGSGDATQVHQSFALAKRPLTYVAAPGTPTGVASTLTVWVDGLEWREVSSLYGSGPDDRVYTVRQADDGSSTVTFGDGVRGARLPTGAGNVVARYRFGAGAASPPAGSVSQLAKPVVGLRAVIGPVAAGGGADAEPASSLRTLAPRSAVLLGRAISIDDMDAAALQTPGVVAARTDWAWDGERQRPVVKVWVIGSTGVVGTVGARLRALTEPDTPIQVAPATPVSIRLAIDLELDPLRVAATTLAEVKATLLGPDGWLTPAHVGIDRPLFRSQLIAALLGLRGVTGVRGLDVLGKPWTGYGISPGTGKYYELSTTSVTGS